MIFVLTAGSPAYAAPSASAARATSTSSKAAGKTAKGSAKKAAGSGNKSPVGSTQDVSVRRAVAGGPTFEDTASGADTPELRALYAAERELFPPASANVGTPWPDELPFPVASSSDRPRVHSSGLPPAPPPSAPMLAEGGRDLSWLAKLEMPDLPVRWDSRVVRYLEFFKDDPRGKSMLTNWLRRSGRYKDSIRKILRNKGLPEDLVWLSMIESGFDPSARSPAGAVGLWQFMPDTGRIYGLSQDRWSDQRRSLLAATEAAADFLLDLHRRFGSWDLAMAAYNMGYGGMLSAVRKYNTNDFWALSKLEGSLPWETTLYVPKILAAAIVSKNLAAFGLEDVVVESPLDGEDVLVAPGTSLATVAQACGTTQKEVELRNPELRASRTPPAQEDRSDYSVKVPVGKASHCTQNFAKARREAPVLERYVVRFGESLEQIAQARKIATAKLVELNAIVPGEVVRGGTVLFVPRSESMASASDERKDRGDKTTAKTTDSSTFDGKPIVVVPQDMFVYPDRRRVFYRVQPGDTLREICAVFKVSPDELRRWNGVDPSARLVEGMTMQLFVPRDTDLSNTVVLSEGAVHPVTAGTDEFFQYADDKGRRRVVVTAAAGDTLESIGKKYRVSIALMERINRRSRADVLAAGDSVVVWVAGPSHAASSAHAASVGGVAATSAHSGLGEPTPLPPLGSAPNPEFLPSLK